MWCGVVGVGWVGRVWCGRGGEGLGRVSWGGSRVGVG